MERNKMDIIYNIIQTILPFDFMKYNFMKMHL